MFDLGQNLKGKDEDGNESMVFGNFIVTRWDHCWASKQKGTTFHSRKIVNDDTLLIRLPGHDCSLLHGMNSFVCVG